MNANLPQNRLDSILIDIGEYGRYQVLLTIFVSITTSITLFSYLCYVFETLLVNHRCLIDGCDSTYTEYNPQWLSNAVPFKNDIPARCSKYQHINNSGCNLLDFDTNAVEICNRFIYETSEISIMHEFNLHCDNNVKALTLVGSVNGIGKLVGLPIAGYFSDKLGRKKILIACSLLSGLLGLTRSLSTSYLMFIVLEFVESTVGAGMFTCIYVLTTEFVGPKKRSLITIMEFMSYSVGGIILGVTAWQVQSWRLLLRIIYSLNFFVLLGIWLLPESVRWLLVHNKHDEVQKLLRKIAKVNRKEISEEKLKNFTIENTQELETTVIPLSRFFKSKILILRCVICSFCWISCIFVYYGLTVNSASLSNNHYLEFILTSAVEIPAYAAAYFMARRIGRKTLLAGSFLLSGLSCIGFILFPVDLYWMQLILYLIGKFGISVVVFAVYAITNEIFPTSLRQTLLSICSMFGRLGNILVPQLILLQEVWKPLPMLLFSVLTVMSSILTLGLPETRNTILPNTIEEAENIGNSKESKL